MGTRFARVRVVLAIGLVAFCLVTVGILVAGCGGGAPGRGASAKSLTFPGSDYQMKVTEVGLATVAPAYRDAPASEPP